MTERIKDSVAEHLRIELNNLATSGHFIGNLDYTKRNWEAKNTEEQQHCCLASQKTKLRRQSAGDKWYLYTLVQINVIACAF